MQHSFVEWHDSDDPVLTAAVSRLRKRLATQKMLRRALRLWGDRFVLCTGIPLFSLVGAAMITIVFATPGRPMAARLITVALFIPALLAVYYAVFGGWYLMGRWRQRRLVTNLRRGEFGQALMFESTAEWILLDGAVQQQFGKSLREFLASAPSDLVNEVLKTYLISTVVQRGVLRVGRVNNPKSNSSLVIQAAAKTAAEDLAVRIAGENTT